MTGALAASRRSLAFVLPSFGGSGAERVLLKLLGSVVERGVEARLIVFDPEGPLLRLVPEGVSPIVLNRRRLRSALPPLVRTLRRLGPGVVFSTLGYVNLALAAARPFLARGTRLVLREANLPSLSLPEARWPAAFRFGYRHLYRRADLVLATSDRMAAEFRRDFALPDDRLAVLPNPVDVAALRAAAADPWRHPGSGLRLVAVGRLVHQKGFDRLLAMMADLPGTVHLSIVGDGPEKEALARSVETTGLGQRVSLVGYRADVPRFLAGADAMLMPSRWEGMPNAALEALACGTPVIATPQSGGLAEVSAEAPPGAITLADAGGPFAAAVKRIPPAAGGHLRTSLLPRRYDGDAVAGTFLRLAGIADR